MADTFRVQGRPVGPGEVVLIRTLRQAHPDWNRTRLSRELCARWQWCDGAGRPKDMAARSLLLKLEARGLITLPPPQRPAGECYPRRPRPLVPHETTPIRQPLPHLQPLQCEPVRTRTERQLWETLVARYHYLGFKRTVGQNLLYLVRDRRGRPLAGSLWGAAAWQCAPRDRFIGWDAAMRARGLSALVNNMRFVVWPWVQVPQLASHVLACVVRRLPADWQARYGQPVHLLETFVDPTRFAGTVYRAANWLGVGRTQGRGRQGPRRATPVVPPKDVYLYPLHPQFRQRLLHGP